MLSYTISTQYRRNAKLPWREYIVLKYNLLYHRNKCGTTADSLLTAERLLVARRRGAFLGTCSLLLFAGPAAATFAFLNA